MFNWQQRPSLNRTAEDNTHTSVRTTTFSGHFEPTGVNQMTEPQSLAHVTTGTDIIQHMTQQVSKAIIQV